MQDISNLIHLQMKTKNIFLHLYLCLCLGTISACSSSTKKIGKPKSSQPNIILLLTDDMGYGDLTCYGGQAVHTPNIDALAQEGMRFTRFYSASAVCSPSRAAILTGKYPLRFGIRKHFSGSKDFLPSINHTLPRLLKEAG